MTDEPMFNPRRVSGLFPALEKALGPEIKVEEYFLDKSGWSRGEWDKEPDRVEWRARDWNVKSSGSGFVTRSQ